MESSDGILQHGITSQFSYTFTNPYTLYIDTGPLDETQ